MIENKTNKYLKKIFLIAVIFVMQISYFANVIEVFAESNIASGQYQNISWVIDADGKFTISGTGNYRDNPFWYNTPNYPAWYEYRDKIKSADVNITTGTTELAEMFADCYNLTQVTFGSDFDTSSVYTMRRMFKGCSSLQTIDVSNFNTSNVSDAMDMFKGCTSLQTIDVSNFNTSNATYLSGMFSDCTLLATLDLSNFDTTNVSEMSDMFSGCTALKSIDLSGFKTTNLRYMSNMFKGCEKITTIDLSNFDTSKLNNMEGLFKNCTLLTNINMSNWDTSEVCIASEMFQNCISLTSLNMSNLNFSSNMYLDNLLSGDNNLTKIITPNYVRKNVKLPEKEGKKWVLENDSQIKYVYLPLEQLSITLNLVDAVTIKSDVYSIGNDNTYNAEDQYITQISPNTKVSDLKNKISTNGKIKIINNKLEEINDDQFVSTGMKLEVNTNYDNVILKLVVKGDVNGDSKASITDLSDINQHLLELIYLDNEKAKAADVDNSGNISIGDISKLNQYIVGIIPSL